MFHSFSTANATCVTQPVEYISKLCTQQCMTQTYFKYLAYAGLSTSENVYVYKKVGNEEKMKKTVSRKKYKI